MTPGWYRYTITLLEQLSMPLYLNKTQKQFIGYPSYNMYSSIGFFGIKILHVNIGYDMNDQKSSQFLMTYSSLGNEAGAA